MSLSLKVKSLLTSLTTASELMDHDGYELYSKNKTFVAVNCWKFFKSTSVCVVQGLMGVFYSMHAPALIDDMAIDFHYWESTGHNWQYIEDLYFESALNCFIAMGCYMFTFTLSIIMFFINKMLKWDNVAALISHGVLLLFIQWLLFNTTYCLW